MADAVVDLCAAARSITVLTGAGMSAESAVPTFRDASTGLWTGIDPMEIATPRAWRRDPDRVWAWYCWRAALVRRARPNAGHDAIARWQGGADVTVATQNVDDLHERAGTTVAAHVHGSLFAPRCSECGAAAPGAELAVPDAPVERLAPPRCGVCGGAVRPGVVWFGEPLPEAEWDAAAAAATTADLVLVVGTSGVVHPFAALPEAARDAGATVVEVNPEDTPITAVAHHAVRATSGSALPRLVPELPRPVPEEDS
ncbi:NAD-dependent deacylase [Rhodococcus rhodnii]|uniref:NAD-dependent protein deacylase n=1 Tax=Rhodococcus rhodnii TaxID=38312 RepID=A0A6P2CKT0_9NOCA|nr:NAD-dependent deacylase [Rhodococcus rhodnii]